MTGDTVKVPFPAPLWLYNTLSKGLSAADLEVRQWKGKCRVYCRDTHNCDVKIRQSPFVSCEPPSSLALQTLSHSLTADLSQEKLGARASKTLDS
ncbi:hypothetical protein BaRGS_00012867 [Batillaria attramentaria]|uniref:Uncharacterized protein n=1 Tax=Batillaria attramentaria TaxID=370345 RepID=A0ABD0L913_9CAEN